MALSVQPLQNQPTLNLRVQTAPTLAPLKVAPVQQPQLAPQVVQAAPQPRISVQPINPQLQINVDNSPRFVPLGEAVKQKYPGAYDDIDSGQLGKIVATQYPGIYDDLIEPGIPEEEPEPEGLGGLKGFALGATKGVFSTAKNLAGFASKVPDNPVFNPFGIYSKVTGKINEKLSEANLEPEGTAEKFGFGAEQVSEFFIPAGGVARAGKAIDAGIQGLNYGSKATKVLSLAGKMGLGATEAVTVTAAQGGDRNEIKNAAIFGGAFPILIKTIGAAGKAMSEVAKYTASSLSGVPREAIEYALKNPQKVQTAIKTAVEEGGDAATQRIYDNAVGALDELKKARRLNFESGLAKLEKEATYTKNGQLYVKRVLTGAEAKATKGYVAGTSIGVPTNLTTKGIKDVATTTLKEFGVKAKGSLIDWSEAAIDNSHGKKLQEIISRVYKWSDFTPTGLNRLRQIVDGYKLGGINLGSSEKQFNSIIGKLRTNLSEYVGTRVPQIAEMNKKYALESEVIDNIRKQLKIGSADPNTALRKLVNVFNPKSQVYRPVVEELGEKAGKDLMSDIAALTMVQWTAEGLGKYLTGSISGAGLGLGFVNPAALATIPVTLATSSPRIVGSVTTGLGKLNNTKTVETIKKAVPIITKGFGTRIAR